ncbi:MAG: hypothetical protein IPK66_03050 [Rhodospirillales bacterium]|nr:hypothetical protein [Rhodospirillales bacterium]
MSESTGESTPLVREAVGVFHRWQDLQSAVDALLNRGFDRSELSLLASEETVHQKLGHVYRRVEELEDDPAVPRVCFVGRDSLTEGKASTIGALGYVGAVAAVGAVVASGGTLAWTILAAIAAGGSGAMLGGIFARTLGRHRAGDIEAQLNKGGLLLWVRTRDAEQEAKATSILAGNNATDVHMHVLPDHPAPENNPLGGFQPDPFLPQARI